MQVKKKVITLLLLLVAIALLTITAYAQSQPQGPTGISEGLDERRPTADPISVQAQAGNVTALKINATRITNRWQGYYGNITGTITLDDADNNTLYSWDLLSPEGEIYAVNDSKSVLWSQVICMNMTDPTTANVNVTLTALENSLGMGSNDVDGVNETFNNTRGGSFTVGSSVTIGDDSGCGWTSLNVNDGSDEVKFNETILTDNGSNHNVIYAAILEQDQQGFQGSNLDFQMIVGDNGDEIEATEYYFYVELS
ncbi:hypothetical protein ISS07_03215 [Candidatus Woesearchaeota archaeon]|nr:hypothetical protein [Candidatus Woesearchaeota archaeon]